MINKNFTKALDEYIKFLKKNFIYKKKNLINYSTSLECAINWKKNDETKLILKWLIPSLAVS